MSEVLGLTLHVRVAVGGGVMVGVPDWLTVAVLECSPVFVSVTVWDLLSVRVAVAVTEGVGVGGGVMVSVTEAEDDGERDDDVVEE